MPPTTLLWAGLPLAQPFKHKTMIEAETIDYSIKAVGKAILFVGFVAFLGMWFFTWYDDYMDEIEAKGSEAHSSNDADTSDDVQG